MRECPLSRHLGMEAPASPVPPDIGRGFSLRRENDEPVRDATKALVRSLGYNNASTFASADEFLKSEQVHDTSCLITDVQMPGLSGLDLQDHLSPEVIASPLFS